jgi:hypothetical protein
MTTTRVGPEDYFGSLTGKHYDSKEACDHYEERERMRRTPDSPGAKFLDSLPTEHLKSVIEEMNFRTEDATGKPNWDRVQQEFVDVTPSYAATPQNGGAMLALLTDRGKLTPQGVFTGTQQDMQDAFLALVDRGVIVPKGEVKRPFDEAAAYAMPFEDLAKTVRGW